MSCFTFAETVQIALGAVALAVMAPGDWHDIALDVARQRWQAGPGGSATEDEDTDEDPEK